jgi:hypothetical protein
MAGSDNYFFLRAGWAVSKRLQAGDPCEKNSIVKNDELNIDGSGD